MSRPSWTRPTRWDLLLPAGVCLAGVVELGSLQVRGWGYGVALEVLACGILVFRRQHTLLTATLATAVLLVMPWLGPQLDQPSVPIMVWAMAIYALARWLADLRGLVGLGLILVLVYLDYVLVDARAHNLSDVMFVLALASPPYVLGRITRRLAVQQVLLEEREELVKREAVRAERDRIARELHDVIAHSVSAMVVQTSAAQDLVRRDPARAEEVLASVADTGRRALAETGRLLHVIRDQHDELGLSPAPGLADVPDLVDRFRAEGLTVDVSLPDPPAVLPSGIDVSVYRVVQEVLTNALRHGADGTASLAVSCSPGAVTVQASNPVGSGLTTVSGLGLLGMRERVHVLGGVLSHGVTGGRFEVSAVLPVDLAADPAFEPPVRVHTDQPVAR